MILKKDVLYNIAEEVTKEDNLSDLISGMYYIMQNNEIKGIGLAAPQVGVSKRVITTNVLGYNQTVLNPIITRTRLGKGRSLESCLSFPGKTVKMMRHKQIIVEGFDEQWKPVKLKLRGLSSYVFQHEIDHLNGICIVNEKK